MCYVDSGCQLLDLMHIASTLSMRRNYYIIHVNIEEIHAPRVNSSNETQLKELIVMISKATNGKLLTCKFLEKLLTWIDLYFCFPKTFTN